MPGHAARPRDPSAGRGRVPVAVDEASIKDIPGVKVVVREKGFIGVVAAREWDAIRRREKLKVTWSDVKPPSPTMTTCMTTSARRTVAASTTTR